jgi:hypothetical protein
MFKKRIKEEKYYTVIMAKIPVDREKARISEKKYREKNKELLREKALKNYYKNRERELERSKKYRQENRDYYRQKNNEFYHALHDWVESMKTSKGCKLCGSKERLHYHHRDPKTKIMAISNMVSKQKSRTEILSEIEKCDILCKPCHDKEHTLFNDQERKERKAERHKKWWNRPEIKERMKQYRKDNLERTRIRERQRYQIPEIRQKHLEANRLWRKNNPEKARESDRRKREKQKLKKASQNNSLDNYN